MLEINSPTLEATEDAFVDFQRKLHSGSLKPLFSDLSMELGQRVQAKIPRRTGRAARGVRVVSDTVQYTEPYTAWLDFGGRVGINKSVSRPFIKGGRYLFPTLSAMRVTGMDMAEAQLVQEARRVGLEITP